MQVGLWFTTLHWAFLPQTPGHGSMQWLLTQAKFIAHSGLVVHSGLHIWYGSPNMLGRQVQDAALTLSRQTAFMPQGDGWHGSIISGLAGVALNKKQTVLGEGNINLLKKFVMI